MFASNWGHKGIVNMLESSTLQNLFHLEFKSLSFLYFLPQKKRGVKKFEPKRIEEEKRMFAGSNFRRERTHQKLN